MPGIIHASRPRRGRWIAGGVVLVLLLLIAARVALTPLAAHALRTQLNAQPDMRGDFDDLALSVLSLGTHLEGVVLHLTPPGSSPVTVKIQSLEGHLRWHDLIRSHLVIDGWLDHAKITVVIETPEEAQELIRQAKHFASMRGLGAALESQRPFRLARLEMHQLEVLVADHTEAGVGRKSSELWIHGLEGTSFQNLADRAPLLGGRPTTLALQGELQRSGNATLLASADPLADRLDLAVRLTIAHLDLRELYGFIAPASGLKAEGTVAADVSLKVHEAQLDGSIKPVIENLSLAAAEPKLKPQLEAALANAGAGLAGGKRLATVIPISGSVEDPKVDLQAALLGLLK